MQIKFCGAAQEVTGSAHLLTLDSGFSILLDCGLYQGSSSEMKDFNEKWLFKPNEVDCLILSHAHIDHSGRIPKLVKDGFSGDIHATHATRSLCAIMLMDSAYIQERDAEYKNKRLNRKYDGKVPQDKLAQPLYSRTDAKEAMKSFVGHPYEKWLRIHPQVEIRFVDAGHILGSAGVVLRIQEGGKTTTVGFSGDVGRPNRPILRDPKPLPKVDYFISESTYGNKEHLSSPNEMDKFLDILMETCMERKGKLLIPAFSIGRTQEIVYIMDQLETAGKLPHIPVYVDSPLAVNATTIYGAHPECYDSQLSEYLLRDPNPFGFNGLTYIREVEDSKALNTRSEPAVIISASGMMNAGRIRHHLFNSIEDQKNTLLIVGYAAPQTTGGQLRAGADEIKLFGEMKQVNARVEVMDSFSAHADQSELLDYAANQAGHASQYFLVHGTLPRQEVLREAMKQQGHTDIRIPELGQDFHL